ncbi:MAG: SDR family oxidoreductase [Planctomycetota bacterium]
MAHDLTDRIAVVTGASAGIGMATARLLATSGARVVINARREPKLRDLSQELGVDRAQVVAGDAAHPETVDAMLDAAKKAFEREADLVVVNAGRGLSGSVMTSDPDEWDEMIRTNLVGASWLLRKAGERMLADIEAAGDWLARPHDIVVLGSTVGRHISPFSSMYGSTKFAVNSLAEALRRELGPKGVRVTLIEPGIVASEFQAVAGYDDEWHRTVGDRVGPLLTGDDIAETIGWVCAQPTRVHLGDIVIRSTRQDYP